VVATGPELDKVTVIRAELARQGIANGTLVLFVLVEYRVKKPDPNKPMNARLTNADAKMRVKE